MTIIESLAGLATPLDALRALPYVDVICRRYQEHTGEQRDFTHG